MLPHTSICRDPGMREIRTRGVISGFAERLWVAGARNRCAGFHSYQAIVDRIIFDRRIERQPRGIARTGAGPDQQRDRVFVQRERAHRRAEFAQSVVLASSSGRREPTDTVDRRLPRRRQCVAIRFSPPGPPGPRSTAMPGPLPSLCRTERRGRIGTDRRCRSAPDRRTATRRRIALIMTCVVNR